VSILRSAWGSAVEKEPLAYHDYSDHRPDLTAIGRGRGGGLLVGDLKLLCPIGCNAGECDVRASFVALGATLPKARLMVHGLAERGVPSGPGGVTAWNWRLGQGYVAAVDGDYARAEELGVDVRCLLVETFGGLSPALCELLQLIVDERQNRLTHNEYDQTTWAARTWRAFAVQRLSVAVHLAAATEIVRATGLTTAYDTRAAERGPAVDVA